MPDAPTLQRLRRTERLPAGEEWETQWRARGPARDLFWCDNILRANDRALRNERDMEWLCRSVPPFPFPVDPGVATAEGGERWRGMVRTVLRELDDIDSDAARLPGQYIRAALERAALDGTGADAANPTEGGSDE
jgi:hypothetical protein